MKTALLVVLASLFGMYVVWVYYLAVMNLQRVNDATPLDGAKKILALCVFWPGYLADIALNIFVVTWLFLELPREWTVTARLIRHKKGDGWRQLLAAWFCATLLDPYAPNGCHCKD